MSTKETARAKFLQANCLIENKDELSTNEYRLFCEILSVIQKRAVSIHFTLREQEELKNDADALRQATIKKLCEEENLCMMINVKEFIEEWDIKSKNAYGYVKEAVDRFSKKGMKTEFTDMMGSKIFSTLPFTKFIEYKKGEACIEVVVNEYLIPYIAAIPKEYTIFFLQEVKKLPSANAIRLYEVLKQYQAMGKFKWLMTDFEALMYSTYTSRNSFEKRVIERNVEIINNLTDLQISYQIIGRGKKAQIEFVIKKKKPVIKIEEDGIFAADLLMLAAGKVGSEDNEDYLRFIYEELKEKIQAGEIKKVPEYIKVVINNDSLLASFQDKKKAAEAEFKQRENEVLKLYLRKIEEDREKALAGRRAYIYGINPEAKILEDDLDELNVGVSRAIVKGVFSFDGSDYNLTGLRHLIEEKQRKFEALLDSCGVKPDFLDLKYKCSICYDTCQDPDTGALCSCRAERLAEARELYKTK